MEIDEIKRLVTPLLEKHQIKRAGIFGSAAKGAMDAGSDVDMLVELGSRISLLEFVGIKHEMEDVLETKVDLVEYSAIKPRLKDQILSEEIRIYG